MEYNGNKRIESEDNNSHTKAFFIGALIGSLVGVGAALLLTPKSGKELRSGMSMKGQSLKEKTKAIGETVVVKGSRIMESAKEKSATIGETVSKQSNEIISKFKEYGASKRTDSETEEKEEGNEEPLQYIPIPSDEEIQRKLDETKRAFDETEELLHQ